MILIKLLQHDCRYLNDNMLSGRISDAFYQHQSLKEMWDCRLLSQMPRIYLMFMGFIWMNAVFCRYIEGNNFSPGVKPIGVHRTMELSDTEFLFWSDCSICKLEICEVTVKCKTSKFHINHTCLFPVEFFLWSDSVDYYYLVRRIYTELHSNGSSSLLLDFKKLLDFRDANGNARGFICNMSMSHG